MEQDHPVTLNIYDLSGGLASSLSMAVIGKQIDGIYHTGIVVYGKEYYFGGGICAGLPSQTPYGTPIKKLPLGSTQLPQAIFMDFLKDISPSFTMATYDFLKNNCNNFTDQCASFLTGTGIPHYIVNLPQIVMETPMGSVLLGMFDQGGAQKGGASAFDPTVMEGMNNPQAINFNNMAELKGENSSFGVKELVGEEAFEAGTQGCQACVVDIFTEWCGPCKAIKPFFASLPAKHEEI